MRKAIDSFNCYLTDGFRTNEGVVANRYVAVKIELVHEDHNRSSGRRSGMAGPGIVRNEEGQPVEEDGRVRKYFPHLINEAGLFRASKHNDAHTVISNEVVSQLGKAFQWPATACEPCSWEKSNQQTPCVYLFAFQESFNRRVSSRTRFQLRCSIDVRDPERFEHIEIPVNEMTFLCFGRRARAEV